jgi:hypothetical protein
MHAIRHTEYQLQQSEQGAIGESAAYRDDKTDNGDPEGISRQLFPVERANGKTSPQMVGRFLGDRFLIHPLVDDTMQEFALAFVENHGLPLQDESSNLHIIRQLSHTGNSEHPSGGKRKEPVVNPQGVSSSLQRRSRC